MKSTSRTGRTIRICFLAISSSYGYTSPVRVELMKLSVTAIHWVLLFDISIELNITIDLITVRMKHNLNVWRLRYKCLRSIDFSAIEAYYTKPRLSWELRVYTEYANHISIICIYFHKFLRNSILLLKNIINIIKSYSSLSWNWRLTRIVFIWVIAFSIAVHYLDIPSDTFLSVKTVFTHFHTSEPNEDNPIVSLGPNSYPIRTVQWLSPIGISDRWTRNCLIYINRTIAPVVRFCA